mmetsp:Transcript_59101/g.87769  ORF Transcript_59101/g.87769 Transcript_59101/m.87769 type:complete len:103 (-) Transcript_59101:137-445(-)
MYGKSELIHYCSCFNGCPKIQNGAHRLFKRFTLRGYGVATSSKSDVENCVLWDMMSFGNFFVDIWKSAAVDLDVLERFFFLPLLKSLTEIGVGCLWQIFYAC